jgi:hypothetical protein
MGYLIAWWKYDVFSFICFPKGEKRVIINIHSKILSENSLFTEQLPYCQRKEIIEMKKTHNLVNNINAQKY